MKQETKFEIEGVVTETLPGARFRIKLENGMECTAGLSGKLRMNYIRIIVGDTVTVELDANDTRLQNGRITWRKK
jgi:translation initiation factor IF-1